MSFANFIQEHYGLLPVIGGWGSHYNTNYRDEVVAHFGHDDISRETHRNSMYIAYMITNHRDFLWESYVEWVDPDKAPFYVEETEGHLIFNEKGYQAFKRLEKKLQAIQEILESSE